MSESAGENNILEEIPNMHVRTLLKAVRVEKDRLQHFLFYGPPGSGKTNTARLFVKSWYPGGKIPAGAALFLNASDERGLESIRERIFPFLRSKILLPEFKDYPRFLIFDEAETLTASAQLALRNVLERPPGDTCCIMFLVNTLSGIEKTLHHRFMRIRFDPLPSEQLSERIKLYAPQNDTPTPLDAVRLRGDLRIFLHAPNMSQRLTHELWNLLHSRERNLLNIGRYTLEDLYWVASVFGVLDMPLVQRITSLSQPGVLRTMPSALFHEHIYKVCDLIIERIDPRFLIQA